MTTAAMNAAATGDLKTLLRGAQLPALPQSAIRLVQLAEDPNNGPAEFAVPIEADPGLTGQVLRFVNSSYFGVAREISSVKLAISMVGIRTIKNFALWSAVFSLMPNPRCGAFDLRSLWQDSLRRAIFARRMGQLLGLAEAEEPFAAALLQDMAVPLLAKNLPKQYLELVMARGDGQVRLSQLEQQKFGWDHAQAAGLMAEQWNLPKEFTNLIQQHTQLETLVQSTNPNPGALAVALSALLPVAVDNYWFECQAFDAYYRALRPTKAPSTPELLAEIDRQFAEFAPVLKISLPKRSLVDCYTQMATGL